MDTKIFLSYSYIYSLNYYLYYELTQIAGFHTQHHFIPVHNVATWAGGAHKRTFRGHWMSII